MKKSKRTLTPKLRFPEFREGAGWKERPLSKVLSEHGHKSTGSEQVFSVSVHKGLVNQIEHLGRSFSAPSTDHYNQVLPGDIVYTKSPTGDFPLGIVKQSKLDFPVIVSPLYGVFSPETTGLGVILEAYFESPANAKIFLEPLVQKGAKNTINIKNSRFLSGSLILPVNKEEQRKIGDFLSSLDGLIAAEGRTLEALKAHKKGLMQQLFPQPGQTKPRLRFPEFRDKGEWEEQPFDALYDFKPNNTYSREQLNYEEGTIKNIHYGDIHTRFATHFRVDAENVPYVNAEELPNEPNPETFCQAGDVIFADASEDLADVGKCIEIIEVGDERVLSGSHTILARPRSESIAIGLAGYLFKSRTARAGIEKEAQGTKVMQISPKRLATINVLFPPDEDEQQRIADCLSSLDAQITAQAGKIDSLKAHKRGLMQQLFPAPEEQ